MWGLLDSSCADVAQERTGFGATPLACSEIELAIFMCRLGKQQTQWFIMTILWYPPDVMVSLVTVGELVMVDYKGY